MKNQLMPIVLSFCLGFMACSEGALPPSSGADSKADVAATDGGDAGEVADDGGQPDVIAPPLALDAVLAADEARAGVIAFESELLEGPKAEGRVGDYKIYNSHVAFIIEDLRRVSGYRYWGGHPVDVTAFVDGKALPDTYGEFFRTWNLRIFTPESVEVVDDGHTSGVAHIRFVGETGPFLFAEHFLVEMLSVDPVQLEVTYDYFLEADAKALRLEISLTNAGDEKTWVDYAMSLSNAGDGAYVYTPGLGFDPGQGGSIMPYFELTDHRLAYAWISDQGEFQTFISVGGVTLLSEDSYTLKAGQSVLHTLHLAVSHEGPDGMDDVMRELQGLPRSAILLGSVGLGSTALGSETWVTALDGAKVVSLSPVEDDGSFKVRLPEGTYDLRAFSRSHAQGAVVSVTIPSADPVALTLPEAAQVTVGVTDLTSGEACPARVSFQRLGDTPGAYAPQHLRPFDKYGEGGHNLTLYLTGSDELATLPPGEYKVTASRGFSYEIDHATVTLVAGANPSIALELERVVDTTGWVSADFHIHALWSPDSYVPYEVRVRQAVAEDLDLPIITEHVYAGTLSPTIHELGLDAAVMGMVGQEITTFVFGHFNAFPLVWDPTQPNMGAIFPFDRSPPDLFEAVRAQSAGEVILQINHPRGTENGAYFSYVGLNPADYTVERPDDWSTNWDTIEAFNGGCNGGIERAEVQDWIGLRNHGVRRTLSSGSDVHGEASPPGTPRNWIKVSEAELRADPENLVPVVRAGKLFVSCGPFVRFSAEGKDGMEASIGETVQVDAQGEVAFHAQVEAPTWIQLSEVRLLENGLVIDSIDISVSDDPIVRLAHTFVITPPAGAWYALEVLGTGTVLPVSNSVPYALTNGIDVE